MSQSYTQKKKTVRKMKDTMIPERKVARRMLKQGKASMWEMVPMPGNTKKLYRSGNWMMENTQTKESFVVKVTWPKMITIYQRAAIIHMETVKAGRKHD